MAKAIINLNGIVGEDVTLLSIIKQFNSYDSPTEVEVLINSPGGEVEEGKAIYNYLQKLSIPVTTKAIKAYSIAAHIFMAGDSRMVEDNGYPMMIHMPWGSLSGGSEAFESAAKELRELESEFADFYSNLVNVDKDSVTRLLKNETFLTAEDAVSMGFATGTYSTMKAVAYRKPANNSNDKTETQMSKKAENFLAAFRDFINGSAKALVLQDANGGEVEFPEVAEGETPAVGDDVMIEGQPAPDGEILMPDGSKVMVEAGKVAEMLPAPEETEEAEATEEVQASEEVETKAEATEEVAEVETQETEVEETAEAETEEVEATSEEISNEEINQILEAFEDKIFNRIEASFKDREDALKAEIKALKKGMGSTEIDNEPTEELNQKNTTSGGFSLRAHLRK